MRRARQAEGLTLAELGRRTGYSAAQISRFERGIAPLNDVTVLRLFSDALAIPSHVFGLTPQVDGNRRQHRSSVRSNGGPSPIVASEAGWEDGEDRVRRRQLLANLAVTAAAAVGPILPDEGSAQASQTASRDLLINRARDAMLGLTSSPAPIPGPRLRAELAAALLDFHRCSYNRLAHVLPRLISSGHALAAASPDDTGVNAVLAEIYTLTTRMLIKLDDQQLGWMAADRARVIAGAAGDPLMAAEAARNLAVLARKAGWHAQAMTIALSAADHLDLRDGDPRRTAERGLLIQSAAYTAARCGDRAGMRELTNEAAAIATRLGAPLLRDHGGGFGPATVQLHRISAEYSIGEAGAAIATARKLPPASLPTVERRVRYYTDIARAYGQMGRRDDCLNALLAAERHAPEEIHARPAVRDLISGLLVSGRTTPELKGLAARCRIT
ncbi:helix-turn-helix transcriptional regulator [Streptosporangium sp. NBC_01495]|uniref:helix-turn-helix domain-containing protein n=1 Tax=Streptosporangium sp. NBC_01495 TaxID=2903899 RepID=UPI002E32A054|nr:helix-turn-helix transcriptional regulator [Streptosporangium sp. NBC_01495]